MAGDLAWHSGIARAHPGYVVAASVFSRLLGLVSGGAVGAPFGTTLFSAFSMSVTLFLLFIIVRRATGRIGPALLATITLGLAHMARWMSTMAEVYAPSLAFSMAELLLLDLAVRRPERRRIFLPLLFLVSGIHFSFHNFALLNLPVWIVAAFGRSVVGSLIRLFVDSLHRLFVDSSKCRASSENLKSQISNSKSNISYLLSAIYYLLSLSLFALGASPILYLAACEARVGAGGADILRSILFGDGYMGDVLGLSKVSAGRVAASYALAALSVLAPAWALSIRGMRTPATDSPSRVMRRALAALTVIHAVFWCRYFVPDQATFILPLLGYLAVWTGIGAAALPRTALRRIVIVSAAVQMFVPPLALVAARRCELCQNILSARRQVPYRDEAAYWILPWKHNERSAEAFARAVLVETPSGATLYADSTTSPPLMMLELSGGAKGLGFRLATPWAQAPLPSPRETECFVVSCEAPYLPPQWRQGFRFERLGAMCRVVAEDGK
jgi:hypothetical protein